MPALPRRPLVILAAALALWALGGYLLIPWLIERELPERLEARLDARVSLGGARFDPFLLDLELTDLVVEGPLTDAQGDATERLAVERLAVDLQARTILELAPVLTITVESPALHLSRSADGSLPVSNLPRPAAPPAPPEAGASDGPMRLLISLLLQDGRVRFEDNALPEPAAIDLELSTLRLDALDTALEGPAAPFLVELGGDAGTLRMAGTLTADGTTRGTLALRGGALASAAPWVAALTPLTGLAGEAELEAGVDVDRSRVAIDDLRVQVSGLDLPAAAFHLELADLDLQDGRGQWSFEDPGASSAAVGTLALNGLAFARGGSAALTLGLEGLRLGDIAWEDGALGAAALDLREPRVEVRIVDDAAIPAAEATAEATGEVIAEAATADLLPFELRLDALSIDGLGLALEDARMTPAGRVELASGRFRAGPIALDRAGRPTERLEFDLGIAQAGTERLRASGSASPSAEAPLAVAAHVELEALALASAAPWVRALTGLELRRAALSSELDARWEGELEIEGDARLADLGVRDPDGVPLFSLTALTVSGVGFDSGARSARIGGVDVATPRLRFARYADGRTNFDSLSGREPSASEPAEEEAGDGDTAPWSWRLGEVTVADGFLDLVDEALVAPFSTSVEGLAGRAAATDSTAPRLSLELAGRVPPVGSLDVDASLDLRDPLAATRVDLQFRRLSLVRLSPYIGTFAGRRVSAGELDLELDYTVEEGRLRAENGIVLDSIELAERIESEQAADLPLELAIALLRDADGRIELDVPVRGDVTDPSFDLTPAIMRALRGAITGVVTAPFRILGSLVGAKQPLDGVDFPYGEATPDATGMQALEDLARVLERRPALALALTPVHAGTPDRDALRLAKLQARIAAVDAPRPQALAELASEQLGADLVDALRRQYGDVENVEAAMAEELEGVLLERVELAPEALENLAEARAAAVVQALVAAGLAPARVTTGSVEERPDLASEQIRLPFALEPAG